MHKQKYELKLFVGFRLQNLLAATTREDIYSLKVTLNLTDYLSRDIILKNLGGCIKQYRQYHYDLLNYVL